MGFRRGECDQCLYVKKTQHTILYALVYVDDVLLVSGSLDLIQETAGNLRKKFEINCLGQVTNFLGIEVRRTTNGGYFLNQTKYITKILRNFHLENPKGSQYPMNPGFPKIDNSNDEPFPNVKIFQSAIGELLYLSVNTRPDIAIATSILGRRVKNPRKSDWTEVKRVVKYLKETINYGIDLTPIREDNELVGYADADWAGEKSDRKSNSGYLFLFHGSLIDWRSRKQQTVSLSSTEAEFISLSEACQEVLFYKRILKDFDIVDVNIKMFEDNQSCLKLLDTEKVSDRTKHIDTKYNFIKDLKKNGEIKFQYCPTESMLADFLTKPLTGVRIQQLLKKLRIVKEDSFHIKKGC